MRIKSWINYAGFVIFVCTSVFVLTSLRQDNDTLQRILLKLKQYHEANPQEKLYLHVDKPFYAAGDNIWFKAYLVEASLHKLDSQSRVVYVDLVDQHHTIFNQQMLFAPDGVTFGDFRLPDTLQEGKYAIRAYTHYMKNLGEDFFYFKEFSVLNPVRTQEVKRNSAYAADSLSLQFFPEGGNLVVCGYNRVAFKAISPDGKGINVEGTIVDENNNLVTSFKSQHLGMGSVRISPVAGKKYVARITKPYVVNRAFSLPDVHQKGYALQVDAVNNNIKVIVLTNADKPASGDHLVSIVVQSRGNAYYAQQGVIHNNGFFTLIPKSKFPDGISQITVFDSEGRPVAERLIHQSHNETLDLAVETDSLVYGKRKMVTVLVDALYQNGAPASGNFSVAVYDDELIESPEEYPLSIVNYLSLTSDLKGYIEEPGYYFKDSLAETRKHLDLLMMINGWRRFTWNDVLSEKHAPLTYPHERGIPISGKVLKAGGKNPPVGSILKVLTMDGKAVRLSPDSSGRFYTDSLLYYDSMMLVFQTENQKGKKQPYKFSVDPANLPPSSAQSFTSFIQFDASPFLQQKADEKLIESSSKVKVLAEATVTAKREQFPDKRAVGDGSKLRTIDAKELNIGTYQNIYQMMQAKLAGLIISFDGRSYSILFRGMPGVGFLIDGRVTDGAMVGMYAPGDVESIELLPNSALYGGTMVNIVIKKGVSPKYETIGVNNVKYAGFYQAREFYSPNYAVKDNRHSLEDKRSTLFWEPVMITDEQGRAALAFFTADVASRYRVVIEGTTADGYPGTATTTFEVK